MKVILLIAVAALSGCGLLKDINYHPTAPGYLAIDTGLRNKVSHISLVPASLFDTDDSLSVLRLGFFWRPEMGNKVNYIVSIPTSWNIKEESIRNNIHELEITMDGRTKRLKASKSPLRIKNKTVYGRKIYTLEYVYAGNKQLVQQMLKAKDVKVKLVTPDKTYVGRFDVNSNYRLRFMNNRNYAYNASQRFLKELK